MSRRAFDGALRRRVLLVRHGAVDYFDRNREVVADPAAVPLNETGRAQAARLGKLLAGERIDRAVCTPLPRTRQTAEIALAGRGLGLEEVEGLAEVRPASSIDAARLDPEADVAYCDVVAARPGARFIGGEPFAEFEARVVAAFTALLLERQWDTMAVFAHGGTNQMLLAWALGAGLAGLGAIEQDYACVNVVDVDQDEDTLDVKRAFVRAMNVTPEDLTKRDRHYTVLEQVAGFFRR